jgi:purine-cytosine permease-like protein
MIVAGKEANRQGTRGSHLPSLLNPVQLVGWGKFELVIMGRATRGMPGGTAGAIDALAPLGRVSLAVATGVCGPVAIVHP